jgi:hypothetical protein
MFRLTSLPTEGYPTEVRFDGQARWLWWGPDMTGEDCVAVVAGRVLSWESEQDCLAAAQFRGWQRADRDRDDTAAEVGAGTLDLAPAQRWLSGHLRGVPHESALNLWNLGRDFAYSMESNWQDRSRLADRCYDKLFVANIPWLFHPARVQRKWTGQELRELRRQLNQAVHLLRAGLAGGRPERA